MKFTFLWCKEDVINMNMFLKKYGLFTMAAAIVMSVASAQSQAPSRSLLEAQYYTWRQALMRGDYDLWKSTTAKFRQHTVRNLAVSEKKPFPASLFYLPLRPPALNGLKFIGIKTKGPTAAATYYGKVDFGIQGEKPTDNAYVLLFVYENNDWKYDTARFYNLSQLKEVKDRLARGDKKVLDEHDGFQPLGKIPVTPPLCPKPTHIAKIFVDCPGRKVVAQVNGISTHVFEDQREAVIISGGLKDAGNMLSYTITDIPGATTGHLDIGIYIMPETPGYLPGKAFTLHVDEKDKPQSSQAIVQVTKEVLDGMKPLPPEKTKDKTSRSPAGSAPAAGR